MTKKLILKDLKGNLELKGKTARVNFMVLIDGRVGFFAECPTKKQSVSIELTMRDLARIKGFFKRMGV